MSIRKLKDRPPSLIAFDDFVIRQYVIDDARAIMKSVTESIEHLRPWMPWIKFEPLDVHARRKLIREWTKSWEAGADFPMGIFKGDVVVGSTGFHLRGPEGTADIGYWLNKDFVGQGIVTRSVIALLDVAFSLADLSSISITHDRANQTSRRVPERLQFELMDTSEREREAPGEEGVLMRWEMTREHWATVRPTS